MSQPVFTKSRLQLWASCALALTLTNCGGFSGLKDNPNLNEEERHVDDNTKNIGQGMPVIALDPRKEGRTPYKKRMPPSITTTSTTKSYPESLGSKRPVDVTEDQTTSTEFQEYDDYVVVGMMVGWDSVTSHRIFMPTVKSVWLNELDKAEYGRPMDLGSTAMEWAMIARNYSGIIGDLASAARNINGISVDNQMGDAAEKSANAYDYWATHWSPNSTTVYGSTASSTIGDVISSATGGASWSQSYSDSKSNSYANAVNETTLNTEVNSWMNQTMWNCVENEINVNNNSGGRNNQHGNHHGGGCEYGNDSCMLYQQPVDPKSRTKIAIAAKLDTVQQGKWNSQGYHFSLA